MRCLLILFVVHFTCTSTHHITDFNEGGIVFQHEYDKIIKELQTKVNVEQRLNEPLCQNNDMPYCTEVENYPNAKIELLLSKTDLSKYEALFGEDKIPEEISQRTSGKGDVIHLCEYEEVIFYPKIGMTDKNDWLYVVNTDVYKQGIRVEKCTNSANSSTMTNPKSENPECAPIKDNLPNGRISECTQKYATRMLVALNKEKNALISELFSFPSCCQCILIDNSNL